MTCDLKKSEEKIQSLVNNISNVLLKLILKVQLHI